MNTRFGFIPIHSMLVEDEDTVYKIVGSYIKVLEQIGGERWTKEDLKNPKPLFYLMVTGGTEELLLNWHTERNKYIKNEPVFLIAHPTHNSLPASLEVLAKIQQDDMKGQIFYSNGLNDKNIINQLEKAIQNLEVLFALKRMRIGLVGTPSDWLVASNPDPETLKENWGPTVVSISMEEIKEALQTINPEDIKTILKSLVNGAKEIREPSQTDLEENVKVYIALKQVVEKYNLDVISVRCFDLVLDQKTTGCFALAQLTDEGIIAGCEGDLVSTLGMLWTSKLLRQIPWMANPAQLNEENNTLWLAHCTVPRSLVKEYTLRSHFESGIGVGIQGTITEGPVTLLRIGGKNLDKLWSADGEIMQSGNSEELCRTQVEVKLISDTVNNLLQSPLGNHLILVKGHHTDELKEWWRNMIA